METVEEPEVVEEPAVEEVVAAPVDEPAEERAAETIVAEIVPERQPPPEPEPPTGPVSLAHILPEAKPTPPPRPVAVAAAAQIDAAPTEPPAEPRAEPPSAAVAAVETPSAAAPVEAVPEPALVEPDIASRSLLRREKGIRLVADRQERWGKTACAERVDVVGWSSIASEPPIDVGTLVGSVVDETGFGLEAAGAEGSAQAVVGTDGLALIAHISVPQGQMLFDDPGTPGRASLCHNGAVDWSAWSYIADNGGDAGEIARSSYGGALGGLVGGMQLHAAEVVLSGAVPFDTCLVFEGVNDKRDWVGGFVCRQGREGLRIPDMKALLDSITVVGVID